MHYETSARSHAAHYQPRLVPIKDSVHVSQPRWNGASSRRRARMVEPRPYLAQMRLHFFNAAAELRKRHGNAPLQPLRVAVEAARVAHACGRRVGCQRAQRVRILVRLRALFVGAAALYDTP